MRAKRVSDIWFIDAWLFNWLDVEGDKGWFLVRDYRNLYGKYDTKFIPTDDGGILEQLKGNEAAGSAHGVLIPFKSAGSVRSGRGVIG